MTKKLKKNLLAWGIYAVGTYIIILPFGLWITGISISICVGFLFGLLNTMISQFAKIITLQNKQLKQLNQIKENKNKLTL